VEPTLEDPTKSWGTHTLTAIGAVVSTVVTFLIAAFIKARRGIGMVRAEQRANVIKEWEDFATRQRQELERRTNEYDRRFEEQQRQIDQSHRDHLDCLVEGKKRDAKIESLEQQVAELKRGRQTKTKRGAR
jgi:hypothetical protein